MSDMKVRYLRAGGSESVAYVSEDGPHKGNNKHSDEYVEVYWSAFQQAWVERTAPLFQICTCSEKCLNNQLDKKAHGNINERQEF